MGCPRGKDSGDSGKGDYATGEVKLNKGDILSLRIGGLLLRVQEVAGMMEVTQAHKEIAALAVVQQI